MPKIYYVGVRKDDVNQKCLIMEARRDKDYLSCELWIYFGERITTKRELRQKKNAFLTWFNSIYNTSFTKIKID